MAAARGRPGAPTGTMTGSGSMRRLPRLAARGAAAAARTPAAAAAITVALAVLGAGPAVAAARASIQAPASAAAAPAKVKYYIVPPPGHGSVPTLFSIAAATLGNGSLFMEIFNLNKGRLQPNGQRLENPHSVEPGWILLLPPDASGPGVHFGPLPTAAKATSRVVHRHSRRGQATAPARAAAASAPAGGSAAIAEPVIGGALLAFAVAGLGLLLRRRRRAVGGRRRPPTHARAQGPGGDWAGGPGTGPHAAAGPRGRAPGTGGPDWPYGDHPSWPASDPGRPVGATAGYGRPADTGRPGRPYPDHPSWPASDPGRPVADDDYPSWPATDPGGGRAGPGAPQTRPGGPPPRRGAGLSASRPVTPDRAARPRRRRSAGRRNWPGPPARSRRPTTTWPLATAASRSCSPSRRARTRAGPGRAAPTCFSSPPARTPGSRARWGGRPRTRATPTPSGWRSGSSRMPTSRRPRYGWRRPRMPPQYAKPRNGKPPRSGSRRPPRPRRSARARNGKPPRSGRWPPRRPPRSARPPSGKPPSCGRT